jgi:Putative general bacterial porin
MKKILLATAIAALSISTAQAAYQAELFGRVSTVNIEIGNDSTNSNGAGASVSYYLNQVNGKNGPLAEVAFIERASNIGIGFGYARNNDFDSTASGLDVGGEFYVPNSDFYALAIFGQSRSENLGIKQDDKNNYRAQLGFLPLTGMLVTVGVVGFDSKNDKDSSPTVSVKYLTKAGVNDLNFEGGAEFGDGVDSYYLSSDFYLDRTLSVGASFYLKDFDVGVNDRQFGLNARKFLAENFSVQAGISAGQNQFNQDTFGVQIAGVYRF